jgi:hypothetical protein
MLMGYHWVIEEWRTLEFYHRISTQGIDVNHTE